MKRINWLYQILIFLGAIFLYAQTFEYKFLNFDDDLIIRNQEFFEDTYNLKTIFTTDAFVTTEQPYYRPMQTLSFVIDTILNGGKVDPKIYHIVQVILFGLLGIILFRFFLIFKIKPKWAFCGVLLYLAHPMFSIAAAWVPARGDLLLTIFALLSFLCFDKFVKGEEVKRLKGKEVNVVKCKIQGARYKVQGFWNLFLCVLFFALALFSKETAALLPIIFLLYYIITIYGANNSQFKIPNLIKKLTFRHYILAVLFLISGIFWLYLRNLSVTISTETFTFAMFLRNCLAIPTYFSVLLFPFDFNPIPLFSTFKTISGSAILIVFCAFPFILKHLKIKDETLNFGAIFIFGFAWFVLLLFPTFFMQPVHLDYIEHRFLLPSVGVLLIILLFFRAIDLKNKNKFVIIPLLILTSFIFITLKKTKCFEDSFIFHKTIIKENPKTVFGYANLGRDYLAIQRVDLAEKYFDIAIQNNRSFGAIYYNRGTCKLVTNRYEEALFDLDTAILLNYKSYEVFYNRAQTFLQMFQFDSALVSINKAIEIKSEDENTYLERGNIYRELLLNDKALEDYSTSITLNKNYLKGYTNRMLLYYHVYNDYENALKDCQQCLRINPKDVNIQNFKLELEQLIK